MTELTPTGDKVVIRQDPPDEFMGKEGVIAVAEVHRKKPLWGTVLAVGRDVTQIVKGDRVVFSDYAGTEVEVDGETLLIIDEPDVLCVVGESVEKPTPIIFDSEGLTKRVFDGVEVPPEQVGSMLNELAVLGKDYEPPSSSMDGLTESVRKAMN